jgi:hypothetical protein
MNPVPILPNRLDWPSAIGNFLLNFGTLEYSVFVFLKDHLGPEDYDRVKEYHLKDRLNRIEQQLKQEGYPMDEQRAFAVLVKDIGPIRDLRNHLAHGHLYLRHDVQTKKWSVTVFRAKDVDTGFLPTSKHVEFEDLLTALERLTELIEEFDRFAGFKTENRA